MAFRKTDSQGNWLFGHGLADYANREEEIALDVKTALQEWVGNCWFNVDAGVDYATYLSTPGTQEELRQSIGQVVASRGGVSQVLDVAIISIENRVINIKVDYISVYNAPNSLSLSSS